MAAIHAVMKALDNNKNNVNVYHQNYDVDVKISPNAKIPNTISTLDDLIDELGDLAFEDNIDIPEADTTQAGVVQLSDATNSNSSETAATSKAVYNVATSMVNKTSNEDVSGIKRFTNGIKIGDENGYVTITYDSATNSVIFT